MKVEDYRKVKQVSMNKLVVTPARQKRRESDVPRVPH